MIRKYGIIILVTALTASLISCENNEEDSKIKWQQSRKDTQDFAYLEERDLEDEFFMGLQVIEEENFFTSALFVKRDLDVVRLTKTENKLNVMSGKNKLLSFGLKSVRNGLNDAYEIDFSSPENVLVIDGENALNHLGGHNTSGRYGDVWETSTKPVVKKVMQSDDELIVDLEHTVSQTLRKTTKTGKLTIRLFLARVGAEQLNEDLRNVEDAYENNYGYFKSRYSAHDSVTPIARFNIANGNKIVFHIKDFPKNMEKVAIDAILAWNEAFDRDLVEVKIADENIDIADPRYNVVKWVANTDKYSGWSGVAAATFKDPKTGTVISGGAFIAGGDIVNWYKDYHEFTQEALSEYKIKLGNAELKMAEGETPVVPYFTDGKKSLEEYMKGFYSQTITHEVGHILGLTHNFKGSVRPKSGFLSDSMMDYLPRSQSSVYPSQIGAYDIDAIRWGYYGKPLTTEDTRYDFCTHRHLDRDVECNKNDQGNVVDYAVKALNGGIDILTNTAVKPELKGTIIPYASTVEIALKILSMKEQLSDEDLSKALEDIPKAFNKLCSAVASSHLTESEAKIANENLDHLRLRVKKSLRKARDGWSKKYKDRGLDCL